VGSGRVWVSRKSGVRRSVLCWCLWQEPGFSHREDITFNLLYKETQRLCTFNAICKDNAAMNCISIRKKKGSFPSTLNLSQFLSSVGLYTGLYIYVCVCARACVRSLPIRSLHTFIFLSTRRSVFPSTHSLIRPSTISPFVHAPLAHPIRPASILTPSDRPLIL
jgi:hypothetical protein